MNNAGLLNIDMVYQRFQLIRVRRVNQVILDEEAGFFHNFNLAVRRYRISLALKNTYLAGRRRPQMGRVVVAMVRP